MPYGDAYMRETQNHQEYNILRHSVDYKTMPIVFYLGHSYSNGGFNGRYITIAQMSDMQCINKDPTASPCAKHRELRTSFPQKVSNILDNEQLTPYSDPWRNAGQDKPNPWSGLTPECSKEGRTEFDSSLLNNH